MAEIGLVLLLGLALFACWKWDKEKKAHENCEWDNSLLREKLAQRRLESDE